MVLSPVILKLEEHNQYRKTFNIALYIYIYIYDISQKSQKVWLLDNVVLRIQFKVSCIWKMQSKGKKHI